MIVIATMLILIYFSVGVIFASVVGKNQLDDMGAGLLALSWPIMLPMTLAKAIVLGVGRMVRR